MIDIAFGFWLYTLIALGRKSILGNYTGSYAELRQHGVASFENQSTTIFQRRSLV